MVFPVRSGGIIPAITGIILSLIGLVLLVLGGQLIGLGGSWYYAIAGFGLIASGLMIAFRCREGLWVYGAVLAGTVVWAVFEVGFDGWGLTPRIFAPSIVDLWLCLPWVSGRLTMRKGIARTAWTGAAACAVLAVLVVGAGFRTSDRWHHQFTQIADAVPGGGDQTAPDTDWRYYGRTAAGDRFSPLAQISPANVAQLQVAWTYRTGDLPLPIDLQKGRKFSFEDTPIKVGDTL